MDKPNSAAVRGPVIEPHRDYLAKMKHVIALGGVLQSDDGATSIGSLHIVNANSRAEAQAFSDNDPFTQAGVYASVTITRQRIGILDPALAKNA